MSSEDTPPYGPPAFKVDQIDHVEFFVPDRREAARWYERVLGLRILPEFEFWATDSGGPLMISSDGGSTKLALFAGKPQEKQKTAGFHRVAFRVTATGFMTFLKRMPDLELADHDSTRLTAEDVVDHDASYSIYFSDPWGHRLEVTTYDVEAVRKGLGK